MYTKLSSQTKRRPLVLRYNRVVFLLAIVLCIGGIFAAIQMPASVFPQADFPRVVVLINNGEMPADEMMATITRPVEEAVKDIVGVKDIRSATGRGAAEVNVFFDWNTDMVTAELYVLNRLASADLPPTSSTHVERLTFASFPVVGVSVTSDTHSLDELWELSEYVIKPRLLRIPGIARIKLVGGDAPEFHVVIDPLKLTAHHLTLTQVLEAIAASNTFTPAGMHEEDRQLYLNVIDGRAQGIEDLEAIPVAWEGSRPILVGELGTVEDGVKPRFNIVSANGHDAVLLNVYSQPDGNSIAIANALNKELDLIASSIPPGTKLGFFYDQSQFVREGVQSVWESIVIGLILSIIVLYLFLRNVGVTLVAAAAIPATILITLIFMQVLNMSFNLMTLGGIAAAIGLVIDDAIVIVEAIYSKFRAGEDADDAVYHALQEVGFPLIGSTLTPVVVFLPLVFLTGIAGVFFRALAITMTGALLISLVVAVTLAPNLSALFLRRNTSNAEPEHYQGGAVLRRLIAFYEYIVRRALQYQWATLAIAVLVMVSTGYLYLRLDSDFLPAQDEGAFVLDYLSRPGTSLEETDRMVRHVEEILQETPEIEGYSRRTGARLALAIAEPNTGDFLVKLKQVRSRSTEEVINELRERVHAAEPALQTEFPGVLADLIGDLTWSPEPIEIKIFSNDIDALKRIAPEVAAVIEKIPGVVDVTDGLIVAGPSISYRVRQNEAARAGIDAAALGAELESALVGRVASHVLVNDRVVDVRVVVESGETGTLLDIASLPITVPGMASVTVGQLVDVETVPGQLEMHRENQRELVAVSGRLAGQDLRSGIQAIKDKLTSEVPLPAGMSIEYGGLWEQQQDAFNRLTMVLVVAILLVFLVLLIEFQTLIHSIAIVGGAALALFGAVFALWITGTSINIVSYLGAIIGVGIVAKNGILMLDYVEHLRLNGLPLAEALVQSGRRRLRPVLMTSLTAFLGLLPLAYGVGAGADMLRPLALSVMGSLVISFVLSLVATPVFYHILYTVAERVGRLVPPAEQELT